MAENDIYDSKNKYERFVMNLNVLTTKPKTTDARIKYYCKNKVNLKYIKSLIDLFEITDQSYVRRLRLLAVMKIVVYATEKDLKTADRDDINEIIKYVNKTLSPRSKKDFILDLKFIWRNLFPEKDEKGRIDESIVPYQVKHLNGKIDKSGEKFRNDKLTWNEFEDLVNFFGYDPKMQAFLTISLESLSRPQELLYCKIRDIELYDNYAKISVSEHGKEGTKYLMVIDSFPFLTKWLNIHPLRSNKDAYLFVNNNKTNPNQQLKPHNVNLRIRIALKQLGIDKQVTCYSLKRCGVTFRRLKGDSDVEIQKIAGWTSTKYLKQYDKSIQDDVFKLQLIKRGLIADNDNLLPQHKMESKVCIFCDFRNKFTNEYCENCKRPLDRNKLKQLESEKQKDLTILLKLVRKMAQRTMQKDPEFAKELIEDYDILNKEV